MARYTHNLLTSKTEGSKLYLRNYLYAVNNIAKHPVLINYGK